MSKFWESPLGQLTGLPADSFVFQYDNRRVPNNSFLSCKVSKVSWDHDDYKNEDVLDFYFTCNNSEFAGISSRLRIRPYSTTDEVKHRNLNLLKLVYNMFGVRPSHAGAPNDTDFAQFIGKPCGCRWQLTDPNDKGYTYNYISEVHPIQGFTDSVGEETVVTSTPASKVDSAFERNRNNAPDLTDEDIPF